MNNLRQLRSLAPGLSAGAATATLALAIVFVLAVVTSQAAQAQTFKVLHTFTGSDGSNPSAGVTIQGGDLYGTTFAGGDLTCNGGHGCGTVYELKRIGASWTFGSLHTFTGSDGSIPTAPVVFGPDGNIYSTAEFGPGKGSVFKLTPSPLCRLHKYYRNMPPCRWAESVLYTFQGGTDGSKPIGLVFDQAGNIYGTTSSGGIYGQGTVYELTSSGSGWTESLLHSFQPNDIDGLMPYRSVMVFDQAGNLYGTTSQGGAHNAGSVFQLTPSGSGWTENVLYSFTNEEDGSFPYSGLIIDQSGNLYGTTTDAGTGHGGTVFELSPSGGGWTFSVLYSLTGPLGQQAGPAWALVMDAAGNLYDVTQGDGAYNKGNVFKLTNTGGSWTYTSRYDFTGGRDGNFPISGVTLDANGNLYGTTYYGGDLNCGTNGIGCGVVWEITP